MAEHFPGPNNSRAVGVVSAHGTVTQCLVGALPPENVGQVLMREVIVAGDELTIRLQTASTANESVTRTLRWRRIGAP